ncbi:MAG TPA: DUF2127 domain-containing protein [Candidatus Paceibacterota bacterium]|nr:DUF2127 domain-containing protein [Candidatus Paceibacterota bacterium]
MPPQAKIEGRDTDILWIFDIALVLKAIDGVLEVLGGLLALAVSPALVVRLIDFATAGELAQDPNDLVANALVGLAHAFSVSNHVLIAAYLVLHGLIKALLVIGIFAKKRLAYPLFMGALLVFGTYEVYRGTVQDEFLLQALAAFDFALLVLTAYEYRRRYPRAA